MGKLDTKFLILLLLPILGVLAFLFGEQIYRGQIAGALQDQQITFKHKETMEVNAKLFFQRCVGASSRHGPHRRGLELAYGYKFKGQAYTETLFAPLSHCKRQDLTGRGDPTGYRDTFPLLVLEQAPQTSYPKLLLENPDFNRMLEDQKRPDQWLRKLIDVVGEYPLIVVGLIGVLWVRSRLASWLFS